MLARSSWIRAALTTFLLALFTAHVKRTFMPYLNLEGFPLPPLMELYISVFQTKSKSKDRVFNGEPAVLIARVVNDLVWEAKQRVPSPQVAPTLESTKMRHLVSPLDRRRNPPRNDCMKGELVKDRGVEGRIKIHQ
jgi:hypothetical protein